MTAVSRNGEVGADVHCWTKARYHTVRWARIRNNELVAPELTHVYTLIVIARQRFGKQALPWQRMEQTSTRTVGCGGLSSVRLKL
jgi:hypothetical protein